LRILKLLRSILLQARQPNSNAAIPNQSQRSFLRYRGIILGGGFAGLSRLIGLLSVAISVPLTVRYLEPERYGMWMTISSLLALLAFVDLGIGNGLVSVVANLDGQHKRDAMSEAVSSAFFMLCGISITVLVVFSAAYSFVPWNKVFAVNGVLASREAGPSVLAFIVCFAIGLPFTVVQRLQMGLQESWRSYLWQSVGSIISLIGILLAIREQMGVAWLVIATSGGPVIALVLNSAIEFAHRWREYRPKWTSFNIGASKALARTGAIFVALQLSVVAGTASDSIIIAQVVGAQGVSSYAVMFKLFQVTLVFGLFMSPLWPAIGESISRGDYAWARSAMTRAIVLCMSAGILLSAALLFFARPIIRHWAGPTVVPDFLLVGAFSVWAILAAYGGAVTSLLNNKQFLRVQLKFYGLASLVALILKVPMARWLGPAGVVWATAGAYCLLYCIPAGFIVRRALYETGR
jgi:O-antigen/teichoic acid export membrane protein